jgi:hypothetical protein
VTDPEMPFGSTDVDAAEPPRRRVRWGAVAGTVVFLYVVGLSVALVGLDDRNRFNRWAGWLHSLGGRIVISLVVLAAAFDTFDGLRRLVIGLVPAWGRLDARLRAVVLFLTWALVIPAAVVIIGPWVSETRS